MHKFLIVFVVFGLLSCKEDQTATPSTEKTASKKEPLQLYQASEMASFMEEIYREHEKIKEKVLQGESPDTLPYNLMKLHTAKFTDTADYDATYIRMANVFIEYEKQMVNDPENIKEHFNNSVKLCISCHQLKCTGPIPRIKKLLIK